MFLIPTVLAIKGQIRGASVILSPQLLLCQQSYVTNNNCLNLSCMCTHFSKHLIVMISSNVHLRKYILLPPHFYN